MKYPLLALCATLTLSTTAIADQLHPERLPQETRWVVHLDLEAFSGTQLWSGIQEEARREGQELPVEIDFDDLDLGTDLPPEIAGKLQGLHLNLFRDLKSVTLFGTDEDVESNLAMLEVSGVVHDLLNIAREVPGYERLDVGAIPMHRWVDLDGSGKQAFCYLQRIGDDGTHLALLSSDRKKITSAARVLRGKERGLRSGDQSGLKLSPQRGGFLYFECLEGMPGLHEIGAASEVTGMIERVRFDIGEHNGLLEANLRVSAADPEKTRHASRILKGLSSFAMLAAEEEPEAKALAKLCSGLELRNEGDELLIEFEMESLALIELLASLD
jgi:hypothetical protein